MNGDVENVAEDDTEMKSHRKLAKPPIIVQNDVCFWIVDRLKKSKSQGTCKSFVDIMRVVNVLQRNKTKQMNRKVIFN